VSFIQLLSELGFILLDKGLLVVQVVQQSCPYLFRPSQGQNRARLVERRAGKTSPNLGLLNF
jgi:hypothetical protein